MLAYVPGADRAGVAALWQLDETLARIVIQAREPALAQLRLAWWRDALSGLDGGAAPPVDPLLRALRDTVLPIVTGDSLAAVAMGWGELLGEADDAALERHAEDRGGALFVAIAHYLGDPAWPHARRAGKLWALIDIADRLPRALRLARTTLDASPSVKWPARLRPLGMLAALAEADARRARAPARRGGPGRVMRMIAHRLAG